MLSGLDERDDLTAEERAFADVLAIVIENFEKRRYPLPRIEPHEALKAIMEDRGLRHKDVFPIVGNRLSGRRKISSALAKRIAEAFRVPVDLLI